MRIKQKSISEALFPKIKRQLLALFFLKPDKKFYTREIIRLIKSNPGPVQRELKTLSEADILIMTKDNNNRRYYQVNSNCSIYYELKGIVLKTFGVVDILKDALAPIKNNLQLAIIFGSVADNTDTGTSDIDLLIVGEISFREIMRIIDPIQIDLKRPINPHLYSPEEFNNKYTSDNHFIKSVFGSKYIILLGKVNEFE